MDYLLVGGMYLIAAASWVSYWLLCRRINRQMPKRSKHPAVMVLCHICRGQRFDQDGRLCPACGGDGCILKEKRDRGIARLIRDLRLRSHRRA